MSKNTGQAPAIQFYCNDFCRDLEEHPWEVAGVWIFIMAKLWYAKPQGKATKTWTQWAKMLGGTIEDTKRVIKYISDEKIGNVTLCHDDVTIECRRLTRDVKLRAENTLRQKNHRAKTAGNKAVTTKIPPPSTSSSSSTSSSTSIKPIITDILLEKFNIARKLYPGTKRGNETEFLNFKKRHKDWKQVLDLDLLGPAILAGIDYREATEGWTPQWKNFQTWINQRCWEDEHQEEGTNGSTKKYERDFAKGDSEFGFEIDNGPEVCGGASSAAFAEESQRYTPDNLPDL